jgi:hypothetical protein
MRVEVGTVKLFSGSLLAGAAALVGAGFFCETCPHEPSALALARIAHLCLIFAITLLAFASLPTTRRSDIAKGVALLAVLIQLARRIAGYDWDLAEIPCDMLGAYAVFVTSCVERFRALNRSDPHEPFSLVYPNDRRRRSRKVMHPALKSRL